MAIPKDLDCSRIPEALEKIEREGPPPRRTSRGHCLVHGGKHFSPKLVVGYTHLSQFGEELESARFITTEALNWLGKCGYEFIRCNCGGRGRNPDLMNGSLPVEEKAMGAQRMSAIEYMETHGHEQLCMFVDKGVGLRAFIAIHDTTLGPALGGVRIWPYKTEDEAITDVLRLSRGMTYKSAAAGLNLGGGKALIMASQEDKTEAMMRAFGRFVDSLGGRYITTEDVGSSSQDLEWIAQETSHLVGLPVNQGGSGAPAKVTAYGIYRGIKACAANVWGADSLEGRVIAVQGFGKVASFLVDHLRSEGARVIVTDINRAALDRAREMRLEVLEDTSLIFDVECDIFSPCALGGILNDETIPRLKCRVVAGSANNQLLEDRHAEMLRQRGILYAPDHIINAGGVINVSMQMGRPYDEEASLEKVARIYDTIESVIRLAGANDITTAQAADRLAEDRIASMRRVKGIYL